MKQFEEYSWVQRVLVHLAVGMVIGAALWAVLGILSTEWGTARATEVGPITVDGVEYAPSKVSGPTVHYETPDTDPQAAFTARHVWVGNGSDNLPCEGGIHWIDNKNVLTVSHCLPTDTTTTTELPTTTTTEPPTTTTVTEPPTTSSTVTTTVPASTTTTVPETTTSSSTSTTTTEASTTTSSSSTTTTAPPTTTTVQQITTTTTLPELPATGPSETLSVVAVFGVLLATLGALTLRAVRDEQA